MTIRPRHEPPRLRVDGLVSTELTLDWADLARLPGRVDQIPGPSIPESGPAVPVSALIDLARPHPQAGYCTVWSDDGHYSASIPMGDLRSGGWLLTGDKEPLGRDRGGPLRLLVLEGATLCWNVKGVAGLRLTADKQPDSVPERPTH